jgi:hypothetical protein
MQDTVFLLWYVWLVLSIKIWLLGLYTEHVTNGDKWKVIDTYMFDKIYIFLSASSIQI